MYNRQKQNKIVKEFGILHCSGMLKQRILVLLTTIALTASIDAMSIRGNIATTTATSTNTLTGNASVDTFVHCLGQDAVAFSGWKLRRVCHAVGCDRHQEGDQTNHETEFVHCYWLVFDTEERE